MKFKDGESVCLILSTPVKSMAKQNKQGKRKPKTHSPFHNNLPQSLTLRFPCSFWCCLPQLTWTTFKTAEWLFIDYLLRSADYPNHFCSGIKPLCD